MRPPPPPVDHPHEPHSSHRRGNRFAAMAWSWQALVPPERQWLGHGKQLQPLLEHTLDELEHFPPQPIATTAHGMATLSKRSNWRGADAAVWCRIAQRVLRLAPHFKPQELANIAWAFATAGRAPLTLFDSLAAEAAPRLPDFTPQNLANTVWAFAVVGYTSAALFNSLTTEAPTRLRDFKPQELANASNLPARSGKIVCRKLTNTLGHEPKTCKH